jgi:hypothetical protein
MCCWLCPRQMKVPSSRQSGRPTSTKLQLSNMNENLALGPRWGLTPRVTDRLAVGHNVTLALNLANLFRDPEWVELRGVEWTSVCVYACVRAWRRGPVIEWVPTQITISRKAVTVVARPLFSLKGVSTSKYVHVYERTKFLIMDPDGTRNQELLPWRMQAAI